MRVTILGSSPAWTNAGGACSGYLLEQGETRLLLDCGNGVCGNLSKHIAYDAISAIIVSHMHPDHFLDLIPYRYALVYGLGHRLERRPYLYLPPGGQMVLEHIVAAFAEAADFLSSVFEVQEYDPLEPLCVGELIIRFMPVRHFIPTFGMTVMGDKTIAYSSDSGPSEALVSLAKDADLFLCEATLRQAAEEGPERGHLSPVEAGTIARRAAVKMLVLTHIGREATDLQKCLEEVKQIYGGNVALAREGDTYILSGC
ncbi:MAG: MBL fold metallo-hydrolase [Chloroflexi bacterium]|nr:MBL fold metallo-hydrolase [Chloroflexota bacterium]MCL5074337.1 MBL fold metallo-hydrolase [Chloroflexota bacterium]